MGENVVHVCDEDVVEDVSVESVCEEVVAAISSVMSIGVAASRPVSEVIVQHRR